MAYRHAPFTGSSSDYEQQIAAANGNPTDGSVSGAHMVFANPDAEGYVARVKRGPKKLVIKGRFTGAAAASADAVCRYWCYDAYTEKWHCTATFELVHPDAGSSTKGAMAIVENDPNASHGYLEAVSGVGATQVLEYTATAYEW